MADELPPAVRSWLERDRAGPNSMLMPPSVARAIDAIPDRTPAQIDALMAADRALTDRLADQLMPYPVIVDGTLTIELPPAPSTEEPP